jgi:hypothetical protein
VSGREGDWAALDPADESLAVLREFLRRVGYDAFQQAARLDYARSPFPDRDEFARRLDSAPPALAAALRLLLLADPVPSAPLVAALGYEVVEAAVAAGVLAHDAAADAFHTEGRSLVSWFGGCYLCSTNPYYPAAPAGGGAVYMGPDSLALASALLRRAPLLPAEGDAADLCCGSGIAGLSVALRTPGLSWTAVDLAPEAVACAAFNAGLNGVADRHRAAPGDLFAPLGGRRFDLLVCNPPFVPVPDGTPFPLYGAGGDDGLAVLRPLLDGVAARLREGGVAVVYAEGLADGDGPFVLRELRRVAARDRLDARLEVLSLATTPQALYTLGSMLARQQPSRLGELPRWQDLFARRQATGYATYALEIRSGAGSVEVASLVRPPG